MHICGIIVFETELITAGAVALSYWHQQLWLYAKILAYFLIGTLLC